jgi:hypothetical protein
VASCISYGLQVMEASSSPARNCSGPSSSSPRMASASEERRMLGFMCRNDYVTDRDAMIISGKIAGPVTAMALQRAGVEATVSRRTPRGKWRRGMLGSAPNGLDTLDAVGLALSVGGPVYGHGDQNRSVREVHLRNAVRYGAARAAAARCLC